MPNLDERDDAEQLNRMWDQFLLDGPAEAEATDWLTALKAISASAQRAEPAPDPNFVAALRQRLLASHRQKPEGPRPQQRSPLGVVHPAFLPTAPLLRRFAIAALLAILIASAIAGGRWLPPSDNAPIVGSVLASSIPGTAAPDASPAILLGATRMTGWPPSNPRTGSASPTFAPLPVQTVQRTPDHLIESIRAKDGKSLGD